METNNIEINLKEKFQNRTFTPSNSAWDRLAVQLDEQSNKKGKTWIYYAGIAASILVVISIGFGVFSSKNNPLQPNNEVVIFPVDTVLVDSKLNKLIKNKNSNEAVVIADKAKAASSTRKAISAKTSSFVAVPSVKVQVHQQQTITVINEAQAKLPETIVALIAVKKFENEVITVDADDLLFAVTHTQQEKETYYAKNNIEREKLLQAIEHQLQLTNVNVSANSILAEVEQNIDEDTFKNNFLQMIKKKVADVTTAVASRNN